MKRKNLRFFSLRDAASMKAPGFVCNAMRPAALFQRCRFRQSVTSPCRSAYTNRYLSVRSSTRPNARDISSSTWDDIRRSKTIRNAVRSATHIFETSGVPEPQASAEHLAISSFGHLQTRKSALADVTEPESSELEIYLSLCKQREEKGVPIQYLVGNWDFHNITLLVRPPVLIPRPETEELVELLLNDVTQQHARILDVGTGSGCIMLAALAARLGWTALGIDVVTEAVELCADNVNLLKLAARAEVMLGTVEDIDPIEKFDSLVSNPPYIPEQDTDTVDQQVMDHEDPRALFGGQDGTDVIRDILHAAPRLVKCGGSVWLEVDDTQPEKLAQMHFQGLEFVAKFDDVYGKPRFCQFRVS